MRRGLYESDFVVAAVCYVVLVGVEGALSGRPFLSTV